MYRKIIQEALGSATQTEKVQIEFPGDITHGDYSTNVALINAKGTNQNPRIYAQSIVEKLENNAELMNFVDKIEIAGPGFINFFINNIIIN